MPRKGSATVARPQPFLAIGVRPPTASEDGRVQAEVNRDSKEPESVVRIGVAEQLRELRKTHGRAPGNPVGNEGVRLTVPGSAQSARSKPNSAISRKSTTGSSSAPASPRTAREKQPQQLPRKPVAPRGSKRTSTALPFQMRPQTLQGTGDALGSLTRWPAPHSSATALADDCEQQIRALEAKRMKKSETERRASLIDGKRPGEKKSLNPIEALMVLRRIVGSFSHVVVGNAEEEEKGIPEALRGRVYGEDDDDGATEQQRKSKRYDMITFFENIETIFDDAVEAELDIHEKHLEEHAVANVDAPMKAAIATLEDVLSAAEERAAAEEAALHDEQESFASLVTESQAQLEELMEEAVDRDDRMVALNRRYTILFDRSATMTNNVNRVKAQRRTFHSLQKLNKQLQADLNSMEERLVDVAEYRDAKENEAQMHLKSVQDIQARMAAEMRALQGEKVWLEEREQSLIMRCEEERHRETFIQEEIKEWKERAEGDDILHNETLTPRPSWGSMELIDSCGLRAAVGGLVASPRRSTADLGSPTAAAARAKSKRKSSAFAAAERLAKSLSTSERFDILASRLNLMTEQHQRISAEHQTLKHSNGVSRLQEVLASVVPFHVPSAAAILPRNEALWVKSDGHSAGAGVVVPVPNWSPVEIQWRTMYLLLVLLRFTGREPALNHDHDHRAGPSGTAGPRVSMFIRKESQALSKFSPPVPITVNFEQLVAVVAEVEYKCSSVEHEALPFESSRIGRPFASRRTSLAAPDKSLISHGSNRTGQNRTSLLSFSSETSDPMSVSTAVPPTFMQEPVGPSRVIPEDDLQALLWFVSRLGSTSNASNTEAEGEAERTRRSSSIVDARRASIGSIMKGQAPTQGASTGLPAAETAAVSMPTDVLLVNSLSPMAQLASLIFTGRAPLRLMDQLLALLKKIADSCETAYQAHYAGHFLPIQVVHRAIRKVYAERSMSEVYAEDAIRVLGGVTAIDWVNHGLAFKVLASVKTVTSISSCSTETVNSIMPKAIVDALYRFAPGDSASEVLTPFAPVIDRIAAHIFAEQSFLCTLVGRVLVVVSRRSVTCAGRFVASLRTVEETLFELPVIMKDASRLFSSSKDRTQVSYFTPAACTATTNDNDGKAKRAAAAGLPSTRSGMEALFFNASLLSEHLARGSEGRDAAYHYPSAAAAQEQAAKAAKAEKVVKNVNWESGSESGSSRSSEQHDSARSSMEKIGGDTMGQQRSSSTRAGDQGRLGQDADPFVSGFRESLSNYVEALVVNENVPKGYGRFACPPLIADTTDLFDSEMLLSKARSLCLKSYLRHM